MISAIQAQIMVEAKEQLKRRELSGKARTCENCGSFDTARLLNWHIARRATTYECLTCGNIFTNI